ncbi:hypothetical protein LCGC14_0659680 [marine sediment metagenome]|uniref:Uncharacterized protein n=1 Tax=marine sediment metagenome TaxID=412755 RepID=A0A0F9TFK9_9ZZZZ
MSFNCPLYGKKYYCGITVSQTCENSSSDNDLISNNGNREWRCNVILGLNHFVFLTRKNIKIAVK